MTCIAPPALALCHWDLPAGAYARKGNYGRIAARYETVGPASCNLAAQLPTSVNLEVTFDGVEFTRGSLAQITWYNLSAVELHTMTPAGGPSAGGTLVSISGLGLYDHGGGGQGAKCQFGDAAGSPVTNATVSATSHSLTCMSPPRPRGAPSLQTVLVTLSGYADGRTLIGYTTSSSNAPLTFRYSEVTALALNATHPFGGPAAGGSVVTLYAGATGFTDDGGLQCLFGQPPLAVGATMTSNGQQLRCVAPPALELAQRGLTPPGQWCAVLSGQVRPCIDQAYADNGVLAVTLAVTLNGNASDRSATAVPWLYYPLDDAQPTLQYLAPLGGPQAGGTLVDVVGMGLLDFGGVLCLWTQPHGRGVVWVRAEHAGGIIDAMGGAPLTSRALLHDGRVLPEIGRRAARLVRCRAPSLAANATDGSPPFVFGVGGTRESTVDWVYATGVLGLSLDGGQHHAAGIRQPGAHFGGRGSEALSYTWTSTFLSALRPAGGPQAGGTRVTVYGRGFLPLGKRPDGALEALRASTGVRCAFSDDSAAIYVPGTVLRGTAVACIAPAVDRRDAISSNRSSDTESADDQQTDRTDTARLRGSPMRVRVALNGELPTSAHPSVGFLYLSPQLAVSEVRPSYGPAAGGTRVTVLGGGFAYVGSTFCRFGDLPPVEGAPLLSSNRSADQPSLLGTAIAGVICVSPAHPALRETPESQNCLERDWSETAVSCGSVAAYALEISLDGAMLPLDRGGDGATIVSPQAAGFTASARLFQYHAFLQNPLTESFPDADLETVADEFTPSPPPPPPSPEPTPPSPSPPPPVPRDCNVCDAGHPCGMCLVLVPTAECPADAEHLSSCGSSTAMEQLCEADGECATNAAANNCDGKWDVYRRVSCVPGHPAPDRNGHTSL